MPRPSRRTVIAVLLGLMLAALIGGPASALKRSQFPVQSIGDRGADVVALQHLLRAHGRTASVTGYFDADTEAAVADFQQSAGLGSSGIAYVSTWERLVPDLRPGAGGEAVVALKKSLNAKNRAGLVLTSSFDSATTTAVKAFQKHARLSASGVVDRTTWRNLIWHFVRPNFASASLCNYNGGSSSADWGTAAAIGHLQAAADLFAERTGGKVAIGDISFEHGGPIDLHATHEDGLDIDIALIRTDGRQCNYPVSYKHSRYDRADTRELLRALREALGGHLKLIYFNDPVLVSEGLSQRYPNHDGHIHVRLCEADHARARYVC